MTAVALLILLHLYIGARLLPALADVSGLAAAGAVLLAALPLLMLRAMAPWFGRGRAEGAVAWLGYGAIGMFSSLLVLTLVRDAALALVWIALPQHLARFGRDSALAVPALALGASALGFFNAVRVPALRHVGIALDDLPGAFDGFAIVQISDLHVGPTIRRKFVERVVAAANAARPDLVVITGDVVDGSVDALREHTAPLAGLQARHGVLLVTGNHEYYAGAPAWIAEFRRLGIDVLLNEHRVLRHGDAALVVAGVTDFAAHHFDPAQRSDPVRALEGAPAQARPRILLAHQPRSAPAAAAAGFDLQLSGHTHGGQFLPWGWLVPLQQPFVAGLHRQGRMQVYVSRGTGYWGPPKRLGAPSEITRISLGRSGRPA